MADTASGEVDITLNGKVVTLRCSLRAAKQVNAGGGFSEALKKLSVFDQDYYVVAISAGLGKRPSDVEDDVYRTGLPSLTEPLSAWVQMLANGGKPITAAGDDKTGEA